MPDKDVDEQFAAIMAHWDDVALGIDPFGDPLGEDGGRKPEVPGSSEVGSADVRPRVIDPASALASTARSPHPSSDRNHSVSKRHHFRPKA